MKQSSNTNTGVKATDKLTPKSLSCLNHLKHGSTAKTLFLADENPEEFFALLENFFLQYQPAFDHHAALVTRAVHDHWIMLRRERTCDAFEKSLHARKPDPTYWVAPDLHDMHLFDRYKTEAARAASRSFRNLQIIQKMDRDEQLGQQHLEREKQRFAIDVERWRLMKQKSEAADIAESFIEEEPVVVDEQGPHIPQDVYVAVEDRMTHVFDIVPSNEKVSRLIEEAASHPTPPTHVVRTYIFAGLVPRDYQWLITDEKQRTVRDQEIRKPLSFDDWRQLAANE